MELLFREGNIGTMRLKNRIIMTPLHMGFGMEQEIAFLERRAAGGAASVTVVMGISPDSCACSMCWINEENQAHLARMADVMRKYDCRSMVQLFHVGRNSQEGALADPEAHPVAPSAVPSPIYKTIPRPLSKNEIHQITENYAKAAVLVKEAGIDGVEINCSAGYLLPQFLSPHTNLREDEYGGSRENRMRFPKEVIKAVRDAVGSEYPLMIRLAGAAMVDGGYTLEDMQVFAREIDPYLDGFSVNGGWHESPIPQITKDVEPGGYAHFAKSIKDVVTGAVVACNRIDSGEVAEAILKDGYSDFVGCARAFIVEPEFANKISNGEPYQKCIACNQGCLKPILKNSQGGCVLNPEVGHEGEAR